MEHKRRLDLYHRNFLVCSSNHNRLDLIQRHLNGTPVVEACRAGAFMVRHLLGNFKFPLIAEIFSNPRRAEGMIADLASGSPR